MSELTHIETLEAELCEWQEKCEELEEDNRSLREQLNVVVDEDLGFAAAEKCPIDDFNRLQENLDHAEVQLDEVRADYMEMSIKTNVLRNTLQALLNAFNLPQQSPVRQRREPAKPFEYETKS